MLYAWMNLLRISGLLNGVVGYVLGIAGGFAGLWLSDAIIDLCRQKLLRKRPSRTERVQDP